MGTEPRTYSWLQRLLLSCLPRSWGESMEASTRLWMARCPCGFERSLWELGGIRWKAAGGRPRTILRCPACGKHTWHAIVLSPNPKR